MSLRSSFFVLVCSVLLLMFVGGPAAGQEDEEAPAEEAVVVRAEITVTATNPDMVGLEEIDTRGIERRAAEDLVEALRYESGVSAVRRGSINLDPTIRGLQETQVGVFVDGTRTFAAGPARMDSGLSHVSPQSAQNIQVVKGPYALTWGSGAMSAIQVETVRTPFTGGGFNLAGGLRAGYGENASAVETGANVSGSSTRFRFYLGGAFREGDDYEAGNGSIVPADFESNDLRWNIGMQLGESALLDYSGGYQEQFDLDYPGRLLDATYFYTRSHNLQYDRLTSGPVKGFRFNVYSNDKAHRMNNDEKPSSMDMPLRTPPFGLIVDLPTTSDTYGGRASVDFGQSSQWKAGVDYYDTKQTATREIRRRSNDRLLFSDRVWPEAETTDLGAYLQTVQRGKKAQFAATLRVDQVDYSAGEVSDFFLQNTLGEFDGEETNWSFALSTRVEMGGGWNFYAGGGQVMRTASTLERYSDRFPSTKFQLAAEFMGNPRMEPEKSQEFDLGFSRRGPLGLFVGIDFFQRDIENYITVKADASLKKRLPLSPPLVYRYINGTRAEYLGGELVLEQPLGEHFRWRFVSSYVRADDRLFDEPTLGVAPWTSVIDLRFHTSSQRLWAHLVGTFTDDQDRVATARFEQPTEGAEIFDVQVGWQATARLLVRGGVENLTDEAYAHHLNSPNPFTGMRIPEIGRQFFLGLRAWFGG